MLNVGHFISPKGHCRLAMSAFFFIPQDDSLQTCKRSPQGDGNQLWLEIRIGVEVWKVPVQVFVAAQVLQFYSLDLVVVQMKLTETLWEIWKTDTASVRLHCSVRFELLSFFVPPVPLSPFLMNGTG